MADDPVQGFGERIVQRARLPSTALLAYPLIDVGAEYFLFLAGRGESWISALEKVQKDFALLTFLIAVPTILIAFFRELQVHVWLDKMMGAQKSVEASIVELMAELASRAGYDKIESIRKDPQGAKEWFYSYVNETKVTRARAFEVWEGYYVSLYLSVFSAISFVLCMLLATIFPLGRTVLVASFPAGIFLAVWATRRWSTWPKLQRIPIQQVAEVKASGEVLSEARRRFG